jgi:uncharacterized membrane protein
MAYKKGSAWRRGHWDKWGFWRKVGHVIAVICAILISLGMFIGFLYVLLIYFGIYGFLLHVRDKILLDIMHTIFG